MWRWLSIKPSFLHYDDVFASDRTLLTAGLLRAIQSRRRPDQLVFLVAHFGDVHEQLQTELNRHAIPYELLRDPIEPKMLLTMRSAEPMPVYLSLSAMLVPSTQATPFEHRRSPEVAVMVAERHPHPQVRDQIIGWCRGLPVPTELGYFMAITDHVIQRAIAPRMLELLTQMGLDRHELISSLMLSRRLDTVLNRNRHLPLEPRFADSAQAWWDRAESTCQRKRE